MYELDPFRFCFFKMESMIVLDSESFWSANWSKLPPFLRLLLIMNSASLKTALLSCVFCSLYCLICSKLDLIVSISLFCACLYLGSRPPFYALFFMVLLFLLTFNVERFLTFGYCMKKFLMSLLLVLQRQSFFKSSDLIAQRAVFNSCGIPLGSPSYNFLMNSSNLVGF